MNYIRLLLPVLLLLTACSSADTDVYNTKDADSVTIGVAYPVEINDANTYLRKGIELAVEQINQSGGVLGKPLEIYLRDDENNETIATRIAQSFADDQITAVIGHWSSTINHTVEDIYEENGVVLLMPCSTSTNLFDYDYNYIFRTCSNSRYHAGAIAASVAAKGYQRIAICYSDDIYGQDFAKQVEQSLTAYNIVVIDRVTSLTPANATRISERWKAFGCEAVVTGSVPPGVIDTIQIIRSMETDYPIFGADNFQRTDFASRLGGDTAGIYRTANNPETLDAAFLEAFEQRYGHPPDIFAVSGYEAVRLIYDAMEDCGSMDAAKIAEYLKNLNGYPAISGSLTYDPDSGEFVGSQVHVTTVE